MGQQGFPYDSIMSAALADAPKRNGRNTGAAVEEHFSNSFIIPDFGDCRRDCE